MTDDHYEATGGRVVRLQDSIRSEPRGGPISEILGYWNALRGERLVPLRSEVDPRGIEGALDCAFIVERIAPGIARFRLAGSYLVDVMGTEVRGMPLSILFTPDSRRRLAEVVEAMFSGPEAVRLSVAGEWGLARPAMPGEMVLLPLKSDLGDVTRALGCLSTRGQIGRSPRRLTIQDVERTDLVEGDAQPGPRLGSGLRDELRSPPRPVEGTQRLRPIPGAPHLRVVENAD